jgi:hypothetical protein
MLMQVAQDGVRAVQQRLRPSWQVAIDGGALLAFFQLRTHPNAAQMSIH